MKLVFSQLSCLIKLYYVSYSAAALFPEFIMLPLVSLAWTTWHSGGIGQQPRSRFRLRRGYHGRCSVTSFSWRSLSKTRDDPGLGPEILSWRVKGGIRLKRPEPAVNLDSGLGFAGHGPRSEALASHYSHSLYQKSLSSFARDSEANDDEASHTSRDMSGLGFRSEHVVE